ncbi:Putative peptidoglycan binding domain-containing protein [Lachnospiraceae bacterium C7]|nr:Putative peptidoglycan binding domain-containing protein [Lachnospiraceae bacterium C7]
MLNQEKLNTNHTKDDNTKSVTETTTTKKSILPKVLIGLLVILIAVYLGIAFYFSNHYYLNTTIGEINCSKKTVDYIVDKNSNSVKNYSLKVIDKDNNTYDINCSDIDYKYSSTGEEEKILKSQNPFLWPVCLFKSSAYTMKSSVSFDSKKLKDKIKSFSFFDEDKIEEPTDAHIEIAKDGYKLIRANVGNSPILKNIMTVVTKALNAQDDSVKLNDSCYKQPKVKDNDKSIVKITKKIDSYCKAKITYDFEDTKETISSDDITAMMDITADGKVTLSKAKVASYVQSLASKYNTFGRVRDFKTSLGDTIKIGGGDYGWVIDKAKEADKLYQNLMNKKSVTRKPVYQQTALYRGKNDIGNTYIEIDFTHQHLYYYKDGQLVTQSDIVTGNINRNNGTPDGVYKIVYKQSPATLVGENYQSAVQYFMPFAYNVGIHDANWRSSFGGSIYKSSGSHGCVNVPPAFAKDLYKIVEKGTPVVAYYREPVRLTAENAKISNAFSYVDTSKPGAMSRAQKTAVAANGQ